MHFFFLKNKTSVCKCVSHTPKLESYIVPNVCIELKYQMWVYHTPKLVSKTHVLKKMLYSNQETIKCNTLL
jgi:hypothetical protein